MLSVDGTINEDSPYYKNFVEHYLAGASLQDIYAESNFGYAARIDNAASDLQLLEKRRKTAREEFVRVFAHLGNLVEPVDENFGIAGKKILDFGCGTGALSIALALKGAVVTGADPTQASLDACVARARYFQVENNFTPQLVDAIPSLPFASQSFDIVITNSVMEFIPVKRKEYVIELLRLVSGGGLLIISTENGLFPVDYYTRQMFTLMRREKARAQNVPYGLTYFELISWVKSSPQKVTDLSRKNLFNSVDKLSRRLHAQGKSFPAKFLHTTNGLLKRTCRLFSIPSDIFLPYATYIFRVESGRKEMTNASASPAR